MEGIKRMSAVDNATYDKAKSSFLEEKNSLIKCTNHEIGNLRAKYAKLETKSKSISDKFLEVKNEDINKKLTNDLSIILSDMRTLEKDIGKLELKVSEVEFEIEAEFPDYNTFLNFFKDITDTIETSDNAYLIDQLVKLVFLNTVAEDKNIVGFELQEAFSSYTTLLSQMGWRNSNVLNSDLSLNITSLQAIKTTITKYFQLIGDSVAGVNIEKMYYKL